MSSEIAVKVQNLHKCYSIYAKPQDRLKQSIFPRLQRFLNRPEQTYHREFWALRDVSFEIARGETVGIIGRNGSGKSTLLQMICGTLYPTSGEIHTQGRIGALLELGSGFNPEFTGRENVYLNAAVLGLSKTEIDNRFDAIAAFADIGYFLDQPIKTYSSGMAVRLAFAVQAQVDPDILIVDEALAVGDAKFQAKCFDRLKQLKNQGTSILLVTHTSEQIVAHCSKAILLNDGHMLESGEPRRVVNRYMDLLFGKEPRSGASSTATVTTNDTQPQWEDEPDLSQLTENFHNRVGYNPHEYRWGDGAAKILDFSLSSKDTNYPVTIVSGERLHLNVAVHFEEELVRPIFGFTIKTKEGITVYGVNSESQDVAAFKDAGARGSTIVVKLAFDCLLASGDYFVSLGIASKTGEMVVPHDRRYDSIHLHVGPELRFHGLIDLGTTLEVEELTP